MKKRLAQLASWFSMVVVIAAFFAGVAGTIGLVANGLYLYAVGWVVFIVVLVVAASRLATFVQPTLTADIVREVEDPVLGKLVFDEDDGTWVARVERDGRKLGFRINGRKRPSAKLIVAAKELLVDHESFLAKIAAMIEREAPTMESYEAEARRITFDTVVLTDAKNGMIFFHNGDHDEEGLAFHCDYVDGEAKGLGVDT